MTTFKIYRHSDGKAQAVPVGWSWFAFLFGPMWAMAVGLWGIGILTAIAFAFFGPVCAGLFQGSDKGLQFVLLVGIAVQVIFGGAGNKWREKKFLKKGFSFVRTVDASNAESAIAKSSSTPARTNEPEIEIIEEEAQPKIRIRCTKCGFDQNFSRSKFGDRTGTIRVKCPKCKEPVSVVLGN